MGSYRTNKLYPASRQGIKTEEKMTPKELYDWAVEDDCENFDIKIRVLIDGYGDITSDIEEIGIVKKERSEIIIIDI